jgi:hypothetical protein
MAAKKVRPDDHFLEDWPYDRCSAEAGSRRCYFPATIFGLAAKRGTGECRLHDGARGPAVEEIVSESERWYDDRKAGRDVPMTYRRFDGRAVPGFPSQAQIERARTAESAALVRRLGLDMPEKMRRHVMAQVAAIRAKRGLSRASVREPGQDIEEEKQP